MRPLLLPSPCCLPPRRAPWATTPVLLPSPSLPRSVSLLRAAPSLAWRSTAAAS